MKIYIHSNIHNQQSKTKQNKKIRSNSEMDYRISYIRPNSKLNHYKTMPKSHQRYYFQNSLT